MSPLWVGAIVFETLSAAALVGALASRAYAPAPMLDSAPPTYEHAFELAPPSHRLEAHAELSRQHAIAAETDEVCGYPGARYDSAPCWCFVGVGNGVMRLYGNDYAECSGNAFTLSVAKWGPPRDGATP